MVSTELRAFSAIFAKMPFPGIESFIHENNPSLLVLSCMTLDPSGDGVSAEGLSKIATSRGDIEVCCNWISVVVEGDVGTSSGTAYGTVTGICKKKQKNCQLQIYAFKSLNLLIYFISMTYLLCNRCQSSC